MDFDLSDDHRLIQQTVRDFARAEIYRVCGRFCVAPVVARASHPLLPVLSGSRAVTPAE